MTIHRVLVSALLLCGMVSAQAPLSFEVASIKSAPPPTGQGMRVMMSTDKGRVTYENVTLMNVLMNAYKIKRHQISGPDWLDSQRFDIAAKIPEGATEKQVPEMLQALLAERFKLALHKEEKISPIYALVPAKGGVKLKPAESEKGGVRIMMSPKGRKMTGDMKLDGLADMLSNSMDRTVVNQTELDGFFHVELEWTPEGGEAMMKGMPAGPMRMPPPGGGAPEGKQMNENGDAPSIFTAVQEQLGLRLDAKKGPVALYMIDHVEKTPTEN